MSGPFALFVEAIAAFWAALAMPAGAADLQRPDPAALLTRIEKHGARPVLRQLWNDHDTFDAVCDAIETAEPQWLAVAQRLRPASDAAATLSLNHSVARALPKSPERVLALIGNGFEIHDICTSPYIEPEAGVAETYQREAIAALKKVKKPGLKAVRDKCLSEVSVPLIAP